MSKNAKNDKKPSKSAVKQEQPKLKKIKTGVKGGIGVTDPCNNVSSY